MTTDADHVAAVAHAIHWADRHLDGLLAVPSVASDPQAAFGASVSSILLRAFAVELALKALYMQETGGKAIRKHDLRVLFEHLSPQMQASVARRFERIRQTKVHRGVYTGETEPLLEILTAHRDDFETWRYAYEQAGSGLKTRPTALNSVIEAALEEFTSRVPE